jgi:hypothetical protein
MRTRDGPHSPRKTWAYGYEISPPMTPERLAVIERLLDEEHSSARLETRTWQARFVTEEQVTHVLVVSDSPDQKREINRRLEEEFEKLKARFSLTPAMAVPGDAEPWASASSTGGPT